MAPLDSLSLTLSSLQEMRQGLEQFTEEAGVRDFHIVFISRMQRRPSSGSVRPVFKLTVTVRTFFCVFVTPCVTFLCSAPAEAGRGVDAGPQASVWFHVTGAQAAHELRPPSSTHTQDRAGHPDQPLRILRLGKHTHKRWIDTSHTSHFTVYTCEITLRSYVRICFGPPSHHHMAKSWSLITDYFTGHF